MLGGLVIVARRVLVYLCLLLCFAPAPLFAQELLANGSFETPVTPANGNNFYVTIPSWTITNVTPIQPTPYNVIRPFAGYAGNPTVTPAGGGVRRGSR